MERHDPAPAGVAYQAARLRWAQLGDAAALCRLYELARPEAREDETTMLQWLEHGGALLLESRVPADADPVGTAAAAGARDGRLLCALRWREGDGGWLVDRIATLPDERGQGFGRWLMTKVEALAIRSNVPELRLTLTRLDLLPYYERLGYREVARSQRRTPGGTVAEVTLCKRVGGTWQVQERAFA